MAAGCFEAPAQDLRALLHLASDRAVEPTAAIIDNPAPAFGPGKRRPPRL